MYNNFLFNKIVLIVERKISFLRTNPDKKERTFARSLVKYQYKLFRIKSEILYSGA